MTNFHSFAGIFCPWSGTSHEILVCSNVEGNIRGLGQIPSNLQVNYHRQARQLVNALECERVLPSNASICPEC